MNKIIIKELELNAIIGIHPAERIAKQLLFLDIELFVAIEKAVATDNIAYTVDYEQLAYQITEFVTNSQFQLIETLVESIANLILTHYSVSKVCCTLYKPTAIKNAKTVAITIEREKDLPSLDNGVA